MASLPEIKSAVVTSSTAGELLRQSSAASKRTQSERELEKSLDQKTPWITRDQLRQVLTAVVPGVIGLFLICWLVYWMASKVTGESLQYPPLARVTGVVKLNGKPLVGATIEFQPFDRTVPDGTLKIASSAGKTNSKGEYEIYYTNDVRGAYVGRHRVTIKKNDPETAKEIVPIIYNLRTEEIREVKDEHNEFNFDLTGQPPTSGRARRKRGAKRRRK